MWFPQRMLKLIFKILFLYMLNYKFILNHPLILLYILNYKFDHQPNVGFLRFLSDDFTPHFGKPNYNTSWILCPKIATFPQFSVYLSITQAKEIINLLYFSIISIRRYHTGEFKTKVTNYCIRLGHSLWSAISCQRKWLTSKLQYFLSFKYFKYNPGKT